MAGTAGYICDTQGAQRLFWIAFPQFFRDQVVERVLDQRLDQIVVCIVALGVICARLQIKSGSTSFKTEYRVEFQQALVYGPEFLHVEGSIVDADDLPGIGMPVKAEGAQAIVSRAAGDKAPRNRQTVRR